MIKVCHRGTGSKNRHAKRDVQQQIIETMSKWQTNKSFFNYKRGLQRPKLTIYFNYIAAVMSYLETEMHLFNLFLNVTEHIKCTIYIPPAYIVQKYTFES